MRNRKGRTGHHTTLSHNEWNKYYTETPILPGDGFVIHHKDGDFRNNNVENLQKNDI